MFENMSFQQVYSTLAKEDISDYPEEGYRLGLDFGTSYTKASYSYDKDRKGIFFGYKNRTIPSVVYFDKDTQSLSLFKTKDSLIPVHYFKATMAGKKEYDVLKERKVLDMVSDDELRENFEFICGMFFLANIIFYSSLYVSHIYHKQAVAYVSMGMPMSWNNLKAPIYNKAIYGAIMLLDTKAGNDFTTLPLSEIYAAYTESADDYSDDYFDPRNKDAAHMTLPEVVNEVNYLLDKNDVPEGYYCIVDIGGGTADFAFITKEPLILTPAKFFFCKYAVVAELGDEIRKENEARGNISKFQSAFSSAFCECCVRGKQQSNKTGKTIVKTFLMGGGAQKNGEFYKSIILSSETKKLLDTTNIEVKVSIQKDESQRYIIASQLAKSDDGVKLLAGIPMHTIPIVTV